MVSNYYNKKLDTSKINNRKYEKLTPIVQPKRKDIFQSDNPNAVISLGFPVENTTVADQKQISLMMEFLNSPTSQLSKRLYDVGASANFYFADFSSDKNAPKIIETTIEVPEEKSEEVLKIIYEEITNLINNPPSQDLVNQMVKNEIDDMKNVSAYPERVGERLVRIIKDNDLNYFSDKQNILMQMTSKGVSSLAKKFLDLNRVSICVAHPEKTSANDIVANYNNTRAISGNSTVSFGKSINIANSLLEDKKNIKQYVLNNNINLSTIKADNSVDSSFVMVFEGDNNPNLSQAELDVIGLLMNRGSLFTGNDNYKNLKEQMNIGLNFGISSNQIYASGSFGSNKSNEILSLMKNVLLNPNFTQEEFDKAKQNVRQSFINAQKNPYDKLNRVVFANNKRYLSNEEQVKILDAMTLQDAQRIYFNLLNNSQCGVAVTLPEDNADCVEQSFINQLSTGMPVVRPFVKEKAMQTALYQPNMQEKIVCDSQETPQAEIIQSYQYKVTNNLEDKVKIDILDRILGGGMSSRLFKDLRENEKIAYHAGSRCYSVNDIGFIDLEIGTSTDPNMTSDASPENYNKAVQGFNRNVQRLKTELVSQDELNTVKTILKTSLLNSLEGNMEKCFSVQDDMNSYYGNDYAMKYLEIIDKITAEDIKTTANYVFANKPITSVVASQYTLDALGLKK